MKQEFEMLQSEMDEILRINREVKDMPVMMIGSSMTGGEKREAVNRYWQTLGEKYDFDWDTVEGSAKGKLFFLATPKPKVILKTQTEIEMDKYDTLQKIVDQLELAFSGKSKDISADINMNVAFLSLKRMAKNQ
jgi:hypothetical protein